MKNGCFTSEIGKFISNTSLVIWHFVTEHDISILCLCKNSFKCSQYSVCWSSNKALLFVFKPKNPAKTIQAGKHPSDLMHKFICSQIHLFKEILLYIYTCIYVCICTRACLKYRSQSVSWGLNRDISDTRNGLCANFDSLGTITPIQSRETPLQGNYTAISLYRPAADLFHDVSKQECL